MILSFPAAVYFLCLLTSLACAGLLARAWLRSRTPLLFWSGLCFAFLALNNVLVFTDMTLTPVDLGLARQLAALAAVTVLLYGLIFRVRS